MLNKLMVFIKTYIKALARCLYLFTVGIFSPEGRYRIFNISSHSFQPAGSVSLIPKVQLSEAVKDGIDIQIRGGLSRCQNPSTFETVVINKLVKQYSPQTLFEMGTSDGLTTLNMTANCPKEARIYTLDLPKSRFYSYQGSGKKKIILGGNFVGTEYEKKITQLYGDTSIFDFAPFYNTIDFVFVDAFHEYRYVLRDSKTAFKLLRNKKGIILWHDYGRKEWPGVTRALDELYSAGNEFKNIRHIDTTSLALLMLD